MNVRVAAAYAGRVLVAGSIWAAIKIGTEDVPAWTFAFDRAVLAAAILAAISLAFGLRFPRGRAALGAAIASGAINNGISWAIVFWAIQFVPSGVAAVFGATSPIWTAVLAHFMVDGDRISAVKVFGLVLGLAGIFVLVGATGESSGEPIIIALLLLAVVPFLWAVSGILMARYLGTSSPIPATAIGVGTAAVILAPFALLDAGRPALWTSEAVVSLMYLALFGSGVSLVLNLWLYRRLRPTTVALTELLITAEAVLIGAWLLGERVTAGMVVGAGLVLAAIALNARSTGAQKVAAITETAAVRAAQ